MIRVLAVLIATVLGLTILRSILGAIGRLVSSFIRPKNQYSQPMPPTPGSEQEPAAQLLRRCSQCGTYSPDSTARKSGGAGETIYFCSADCQSKASVKA